MPISRATGRRRFHRRKGRRVGAYLNRPRWTRRKRVAQGLTRNIQWFKTVSAVTSDTGGNIGLSVTTANVGPIADFVTYGTLYSQYKVLKVMVKLFPSNVGGESLQILPGGGAPPPSTGLPMLQRGDALTYTGKESTTGGLIADLITRPSARLFQPRRFHKRWTTRPNGYPTWGELGSTGTITVPDPWDNESGIHLIGENFTPVQAPGQQNYFYAMTLFKVLFRSRQE